MRRHALATVALGFLVACQQQGEDADADADIAAIAELWNQYAAAEIAGAEELWMSL